MQLNQLIENVIRKESQDESNPDLIRSLAALKPNPWLFYPRLITEIITMMSLAVVSIVYTREKTLLVKMSVFFPVSFLLASRLRFFSMVLHEATHSNLCNSKGMNTFLGRIVSMIVPFSFERYSFEHTKHHQNLGVQSKDPDFNYSIHELVANRNRIGNSKFVLAFLIAMMPYARFRIWDHLEPVLWRVQRVAIHLFNFSAAALFGFGFDFTILFFLTYFVMFPIIRFMGDYFDHGQLVAVTSGIQSKNHPRVGWIVELLFLPMNDKFHLVHHLFPKIPSKNLGQAHIFLLGSSRTYKQLHSEYDGALVSSLDSTMVREFHD